MTQNYCNIRYEYFRYSFFSICIIATIAFNILCLSQYLENGDLCVIDFQKFNNDKDRIYPSISICLNNPFIEKRLAQYNKDFTISNYRNFLKGEFWDSRMLGIDYDNVTVPMIDNLLEYGVQYPNWTWFWYKKDSSHYAESSKPYISYRNSDDKCFAIDIDFRQNWEILRFGLKMKSDIFYPSSIRPDRYIPPKQGFQVFLHYPQQFVRSYAAGIGKWNWPSRDNKPHPFRKGAYIMDVMVQNLNIIIRRDKPNQDSPCDEDWLNYDYNVWKSAIDELECRHPLWRNHSYPLCNSKEAMQKGRPPDFEDLERHPICCRRIEKFQFGYYEDDMEDDTRNSNKGNWFQLNIRFGDSIYKEITKVRKFDYQSLIGEHFLINHKQLLECHLLEFLTCNHC